MQPISRLTALPLVAILAISACSVHTEKAQNGEDKNVDIETPIGNMHVGKDVDARDAGVDIYPGARVKQKKGDDDNEANLSFVTSAFGIKVVAADYISDASPDKVKAFYHDQLRKFGNVIECHADEKGRNVNVESKKGDHTSGPVKCEGNNTGPVLELKAGTEDNQHVVSIEKKDEGTDFSVIYIRLRGKQGDI